LMLVLQARFHIEKGRHGAHQGGAAFARQHYRVSIKLR
jgi:hypothetical protein